MLTNCVCWLQHPCVPATGLYNARRLFFIILLLFSSYSLFAQSALRVEKDTVRVNNATLIIQNPTRNVLGFLYNEGNGKTSFRKLDLVNVGDSAIAIAGQDTLKMSVRALSGKSLQFKTGVTPGYPGAGAQTYTSTDFLNRNLKIWRSGIFQYRDSIDGVLVDSTLGKITFYPPLVNGERIYIEALSGIELVAVLPPAPILNYLTKLAAGIFFTSDNTYTIKWATNNTTLTSSPKVVGIGSSTLAGYNLSSPNRLGDKIEAWLGQNTTTPTWINLAVSGYASVDLLPVAMGGKAGTNIDSAVNTNPDFIFVSLPSNDAANNVTAAQFMTNLRIIDTIAGNRGIPVFFETTQPRTIATTAQQTLLKVMADSVRKAWPTRYVEGFTPIVDNTASTDAVIKAVYDNGDGVHLTSAGNQFIADSLFARWNKYFTAIGGINSYVIDTSANQTTWTQFDVVAGANTVKKSYPQSGSNPLYFRVKAVFTNGTSSAYSNIVRLYKPVTTTTPPATPDHRVLIDLGGDGISTVNGSGQKDGKLTPSPDAGSKYWNNFTGSGGITGFAALSTFRNLVTTANQGTTMGISIIGQPEGSYGNGSTRSINYLGATAAVGDYPYEAVTDNVYFESSINSGGGVIMRIRGLIKTNTYSIKLWGARVDDNSSNSRILEAKLSTEATWAASKTVATRYASSATPDYNRAIVFSGITNLDSVDINLRVGSGSQFAHLSVVDIGITGSLPAAPLININDTTQTLPKDSIQLNPSFNANGNTITSYQWTQVSGPNNVTFANPNALNTMVRGLTNGVFVFRVTATTAQGLQVSDQTSLWVYPDNGGLKTLRLNFSATATPPIPGWFNAYGDVTNTRIIFQDPVTSWGVDNVKNNDDLYWSPLYGENASDDDGQVTGTNGGIIPDLALKGYWFNFSTGYTSLNNIVLTGLNPAKTYTLKLVGSRSTAGELSTYYSAFRVNGGAEQLQNVRGNTTTQTVFTSVTPDANGKIGVAVYRPSNSGTYGSLSFINALIIQEN